ncbi:MAG: helicase HerA-like domain-containing protein, partial [Pseudomonadota bacterium]
TTSPFNDAPPALLEKIEQVVRLIRSKGVGVFFITQNPLDVPDIILGQLGNRVQHALRAFTPRDQKAVKAAAETFRPNPRLDTVQAIMELAVGEALVSFLEAGGTPAIVERALILPPSSRIGPITTEERAGLNGGSPVKGRYEQTVDRDSAYERLSGRIAGRAADSAAAGSGGWQRPGEARSETSPRDARADESYRALPRAPQKEEKGMIEQVLFGTGRRQGVIEAAAKSVARNMAGQVGRQIVRGILGSIFKG